jgi:3-hydroxyisobutyrate dehydrogenase-like beta-hydroxyacid dehydrogenase
MGQPMSAQLIKAGHVVLGFDLAGTRERLPAGAEPAGSVEELAQTAPTILLSLPDGRASIAVCDRIARTDERRTQTVIDLSTIGIAAARECAERLHSASIGYVDAPVSGGVAGATAGTLAIMIGAPRQLFDRVKPLLEPIGKNIFLMGELPGHGQAMKLLNNYIIATALAATSEAVVFGERVGLDMAQMLDVLNVSSGRTQASAHMFPKHVLPRTYDFGFMAGLMSKDISLFVQSAAEAGVSTELANQAAAIWQRFGTEAPGADFTRIHQFVEAASRAQQPS